MLKGSAYSLNILLLKHLRPSFVRIYMDIAEQYCSSYLVLGYVKILAEERAKAYLLCFRIYGSKKSRSDQEYPHSFPCAW